LSQSVPTKFLDMLPLPVVVVEFNEETLNHTLVFLNNKFNSIIGWSLEEIPDKDHWWQKVYPDLQYQKVVESLWELNMESFDSDKDSFVSMTVNIKTKHNGVKRFNVCTELKSVLIDGFYVVTFEEVNEQDNN
jgi:hypothetical protein